MCYNKKLLLKEACTFKKQIFIKGGLLCNPSVVLNN